MKTVPIHTIKPNPENPRVIRDEAFRKLVRSIQDAPWMLELRPIVVDANNVVLGGNMRLKACEEAGVAMVPVIDASKLTEAQQREFIVKDNLGYGEWDYDKLRELYELEELDEWGLELPELKSLDAESSDNGEEYKATHEVVVECVDEKEQERVFEYLKKGGYKCRVLSI